MLDKIAIITAFRGHKKFVAIVSNQLSNVAIIKAYKVSILQMMGCFALKLAEILIKIEFPL